MGAIAPQITSLTIVYSTVYSDADQRKHQSSASLAFVRGIHRGPVNSPHKWPVTRKMFPFHDVIMDGTSGSTVLMTKTATYQFFTKPRISTIVFNKNDAEWVSLYLSNILIWLLSPGLSDAHLVIWLYMTTPTIFHLADRVGWRF